MFKIIGGIAMLGILVFIHELGHFLVAKWCRVKVLKFSLGFGPRIFSRTWGETEYQICAIPLGGYVQMLGEDADEASAPLSPEEKRRSFAEKPVWQRLAIVAAGPAMNLILPFLILPLAYFIGLDQPAFLEQPACIGHVVEDSAAFRAGVQSGDCIREVNGESAVNWTVANKQVFANVGRPVTFELERGTDLLHFEIPRDAPIEEGLQGVGLLPKRDAVVGYLEEGLPAARGGLLLNDRIVAIGGAPVTSWYDIHDLVQASKGQPLAVTVVRAGKELTFDIEPQFREPDGNADEGRFVLGVGVKVETVFKRFPPVEAFREGVERSAELVDMTLFFLQKLFAGAISAKSIGGPIMVVQMAGAVAQEVDLAKILSMLAFLSIQLGILNLLPVPILDGGHLLFGLVELVRRKPLSEQAREIAQQVGLVLIVLLMVWAFYNDIMRLAVGG